MAGPPLLSAYHCFSTDMPLLTELTAEVGVFAETTELWWRKGGPVAGELKFCQLADAKRGVGSVVSLFLLPRWRFGVLAKF